MKNLKIKSFKSEMYKDHEIHIRTFGYYFDFLFVHKGKIHTAFLKFNPDFKNRMLYLIGKQELPYSDEQAEKLKAIVFNMATQVVDELCSKK